MSMKYYYYLQQLIFKLHHTYQPTLNHK